MKLKVFLLKEHKSAKKFGFGRVANIGVGINNLAARTVEILHCWLPIKKKILQKPNWDVNS